jgi:hypothetical protein
MRKNRNQPNRVFLAGKSVLAEKNKKGAFFGFGAFVLLFRLNCLRYRRQQKNSLHVFSMFDGEVSLEEETRCRRISPGADSINTSRANL